MVGYDKGMSKPESTDPRRSERHQMGAMARQAGEGMPDRTVRVTGEAGAPGSGRAVGEDRRVQAKQDGIAQPVSSALYDVESNDPDSLLVDRSHVTPEELQQITGVMAALGRLREAEQRLSEASQRYMKLGKTDMRALHLLIVAQHTKTVVTPSMIAAHLRISSASTTKLLDRLESGGHIVRAPHPNDRRALSITITPETREAAIETVGRLHAQRFHAAARLTSEERATVVRFLDDMTEQIGLGKADWAEKPETSPN